MNELIKLTKGVIIIDNTAPLTNDPSDSLLRLATICLKEDLYPMGKVIGNDVLTHKPIVEVVFVDERTNIIYNKIVYDDHTQPYIFVLNTETL